MKPKVVFLDIDGTLTLPGGVTPPESAVRAMKAARERGHKLILCTGRNMGMLAPLLPYGFDGVVGCAGGYVKLGERVLFDCPMSADESTEALRLLQSTGVVCTLEALEKSYGDEQLGTFLDSVSEGGSELQRWRSALFSTLDVRPMAEYDGRPVYKIVIMCRREAQLIPAKNALEDRFAFVMQDADGYGCLNGELINRKFNKGDGVRRIMEALGADMADSIGFGDSSNDREMLQTVGLSVCMGNGSPAMKQISDIVAPCVSEDGLAITFESLGLTKSL